MRTYKLTPQKHNRSGYYCFHNDAQIQRFFKQLITIDEFGFSSREQIYTKADELQKHIADNESKEKLTRVKELIAFYDEIVEGNYIDNLIKEQNKTRQTGERHTAPAKKHKR